MHCTPEQLALAALREPLPEDDAAHLASCDRCRAELASLQRPVDLLAVPQLAAGAPAVPPPPAVWASIAAATGVSAVPRAGVGTSPERPPADVRELVPRPRRAPSARPRWLAVAASLVLGLAVGGGVVALTRDSGDNGTVVAETGLDPLADAEASGRATVRSDGGTQVLEVDLRAPALQDAYYEVWLLEPDAQRMVQVGVLHRGDTVLPLPDGIDLDAYPLVDVSVEPLDGVPTHSGVSVARGELRL